MSAVDRLPRPVATAGAAALTLDRLELEIYRGLEGIERPAAEILASAQGEQDEAIAARALLVRTDVLSRSGHLDEALAVQREVGRMARERRDADIEARAGCLLASTYYRLGLATESQDAAETAVRRLSDDAPAHWHAEHLMVLALFTSYDRAGGVDYGLFDAALRKARAHGDPILLLAVLNNYAYTAADGGELARATRLADEMQRVVGRTPALASLATLDTIAWVRLAQGQTDHAGELLEAALVSGARVEPDDHAAVLAHLAAVRRRQGRGPEASALLLRARALALATNTPEVAVGALRDLAELAAEAGDHRRAYRRLARYVHERDGMEREDSERRAAVLQSVYGMQAERDQRRHYERLASRDALTGLANRRLVEAHVPKLLDAGAVTVAMIDVDHFKTINDRFSHAIGDLVLKELGALLAAHARDLGERCFAARLGGEEFLMIMPGYALDRALVASEALRARVAAHVWPEVPAGVHPTISAGLAAAGPGTTALTALLGEADRCLYAAKAGGRDRVVARG